MFEQTFKNIDDKLWKDAGCSSELDYVEQTSWILFLKYLDDLEKDRADAAELAGKDYTSMISKKFKWDVWAAPRLKGDPSTAAGKSTQPPLRTNGAIDHHNAKTGDDLIDFVNNELFPYLKKFKTTADHADTIEYKIGEIFSELKNRIQSGYNLREVINLVDELRFRSSKEKHEMSALYEDKIKNMGNAGRNGGEYYTPRPLIKTIVKVVKPKIGEKIYDGAVGSAGFLVEAFEFLRAGSAIGTKEAEILQKRTFYGKEKKSLAYIIGIMNMILHGIDAPNILHTNTLAENLSDIQERDRYEVVLANPPFGGKERAEVQGNFPIKTGETAFLFLQHFIKILKAGGRAGVVIKNTFLSNTDNASVSLRKQLLDQLEQVGFGHEELTMMQSLINAENSDLFDVLEYVSFLQQPITREKRVALAQSMIFASLGNEQKQFVEFVLSKYIETGVEELSQEKLPQLLTLKYKAIEDAKEILGTIESIRKLFTDFQGHLYQSRASI